MVSRKAHHDVIVKSVIHWFEKAVLGLNLCPFAVRPYESGQIVFELSDASDDESCISDVYLKLLDLDKNPEIETLVLICKSHLTKFEDYNQFLALTDALLDQEGWLGVYQIASFHPDYCFEGCTSDARENWTNRSPYPLLHFIRESSITDAVSHYPDVDSIPERNIQTLNNLPVQRMQEIFGSRFKK